MRAFLLYIDDWLSSKRIRQMDAHEELAYFHLLLAEATEPDCGLPADEKQLAILSGLHSQWFKPTKDRGKRLDGITSGQKILQCFCQRDGRLFNDRLYREWQHQQQVKESRSEAGRLGGRPKKQTESNSLANGKANGKQNETNDVCVYSLSSEVSSTETLFPVSTPKKKKTIADIERSLGLKLMWWNEFWEIYPCHEGKLPAMEAFRDRVTSEIIWERVKAGALKYREAIKADPNRKVKYAQGWLNDERWTDEVTANGSKSKIGEAMDIFEERYGHLIP